MWLVWGTQSLPYEGRSYGWLCYGCFAPFFFFFFKKKLPFGMFFLFFLKKGRTQEGNARSVEQERLPKTEKLNPYIEHLHLMNEW